MTYKLGINTGFAVNRYPELDELIYIIKKKNWSSLHSIYGRPIKPKFAKRCI